MTDILRQVLEAKGINAEEVLAEVNRRQGLVNLATEVGRRLRQLGVAEATILVKTTDDGKVVVKVDADGTTAIAEIAPTPTVATTEGRKDAKGKAIADKLAQAVSAFGLELKEWQVRSIAFHFPQIAKSLLKQTNNGILNDPNFREAVRMYAEWHPERRGELPQEVLANANADANTDADADANADANADAEA
jgi:hypothetical protein